MGYAYDTAQSLIYATGATRLLFDRQWASAARRMTPYQEWNYAKKAIFIHVPKAAGLSVKKSLGIDDHPVMGHCSAYGFKLADPDAFGAFYRFTIVREPLSRLRSAFDYLKTSSPFPHDRDWARRNLADCADFSAFLAKLESFSFRARVMPWIHFRPQSHFLTDADGALLTHDVFKLEELHRTFPALCARLGIGAQLPHVNRSSPAEAEKSAPVETAVVRDLYAEDYALLGYAL